MILRLPDCLVEKILQYLQFTSNYGKFFHQNNTIFLHNEIEQFTKIMCVSSRFRIASSLMNRTFKNFQFCHMKSKQLSINFHIKNGRIRYKDCVKFLKYIYQHSNTDEMLHELTLCEHLVIKKCGNSFVEYNISDIVAFLTIKMIK